MSYWTINSGKNLRREYKGANRSPLFRGLPEQDYARGQKLSYSKFLHERLPQLLSFYFPAEFSDYNNHIKIRVENLVYQEPEITEEMARAESLTWNYLVSFDWKVSWDCHKIQIKLLENDLQASLIQWIEESFKIKKFTCKEKTTDRWEIKEAKGNLKIELEILEKEENNLIVKFHCQQEQKVDFCHLPKMTPQGNFIINGHNKVVVFQSVRAPAVYYYLGEEENEFLGEIIPFKGPWISITYSAKKPLAIELKFLNSGLVVDFLNVLKTFEIPPELLGSLFNEETLNTSDYQEVEKLEIGTGSTSLPRFLFTDGKGNSYFNLGKLGRKKYNQKVDLIQQLKGQTLAEDLLDTQGKLILKKNAVLAEKNLQILQNALQKKKISSIVVPHSINDLYAIKIKSPKDKEKVILAVGTGEKLPEDKTYFDLADLICAVTGYINLYHGLGNTERREDEDKLENQVIRRVGDLVYNIFDNKLGGFLQDIDNKYLSNYLSQLKKVDLAKIPNLKDFDNLIKHFFNNSALVRLQNQNNPLAVISDGLVSSVMGLGGRNSVNATLAARNVDYSFSGRYDPVETPEGRNTGLVRRITIEAGINDDGQIITPYFPIRNGLIVPSLVYLTSEEERDKYIAHFNVKIDEKNQIMEETVLAIHQEKFVRVPREKLDFIYSSFWHLNSVTSATIPFFHHNDATRMLMATNMQRQAVTLLKNQAPLVASGIEASLLNNSPLVVKAEEAGIVEYVDSSQIIIKEKNKEKKTYLLEQLAVSNKNIINFSFPLVKKGDKVEKEQMIACGNHANDGELSLGYNLRVGFLCFGGYNYEDGFAISERLVKEDILTSFFVKKHTVIRHNTKYGPEIFTASFPRTDKKQFPQLDKEGIVKIGSRVKGNDILVGKLTPEPSPHKEAEEELLLMSILGEKAQRFVNSSLRLPAEEAGIVYQVKRKEVNKNKNDLELVEVYVAQKRKIEVGDKLTTRFGNKGVVAKIVPEADMPFDEEGKPIDIIFNPLGVPTRMNIGQLLETILASAAHKLNIKLLCRPFNSPSPEAIKGIIKEAGIKNYGTQKLFDGQTGLPFSQEIYTGYVYVVKLNHMVADKFHARNVGPYSLIYQQPVKGRSQGGGQRFGEMEIWGLWAHGAAFNVNEITGAKSDDIYKRNSLQNALLFADRQIDLRSNQSESFNLLLQHLRGIGFDLQATDYHDREIDFYEAFSRKSPKK